MTNFIHLNKKFLCALPIDKTWFLSSSCLNIKGRNVPLTKGYRIAIRNIEITFLTSRLYLDENFMFLFFSFTIMVVLFSNFVI